ncbi:cobalamin B12-binding domain-containing protein [Phosphitispora sp. TUW77]|uniref:cobalamin B12-binding domain-containing protein n=1 Tax=Phosphitispora sp. TUW77 TaxID=3152361 RepID=UPI003AB12F4E
MNIAELAEAVLELEDDKALALVQQSIDEGMNAREVLEKGVLAGLKEIGIRFGKKEYFLAELTMGADLVDQCMELLAPHLPVAEGPKRGVVVIGAVQGDLHSIGYGLVQKQLELAGYEVHEVGINCPSMKFIDKAKEVNADIIGLSAFLVTTIPYCDEVINYLKDMGTRDKYKVIIGGTECNHEVAAAMGADGFAPDASEAVKLCDKLLGHA